MSAEIISFTHRRTLAARDRRESERDAPRKSMRMLVFRSRAVILEIDEATLLQDVCFDFGKAERKLIKLKQHLRDYKARTAKEIVTLTKVEAKLGAAVDAARRELELRK
jgi:hypothetical protein